MILYKRKQNHYKIKIHIREIRNEEVDAPLKFDNFKGASTFSFGALKLNACSFNTKLFCHRRTYRSRLTLETRDSYILMSRSYWARRGSRRPVLAINTDTLTDSKPARVN